MQQIHYLAQEREETVMSDMPMPSTVIVVDRLLVLGEHH